MIRTDCRQWIDSYHASLRAGSLVWVGYRGESLKAMPALGCGSPSKQVSMLAGYYHAYRITCPRTYYFFLLKRRSFTSRKVYISLETLLCFLQLSDRAYVSRARCIDIFLLLVVLAPHDSTVVSTCKSLDCLAYCICHCSA